MKISPMWIVVETIENGKTFSTAVPKTWIANDCLLWPTKDCELNDARKNNKKPQNNWIKLPFRELSQTTGMGKIIFLFSFSNCCAFFLVLLF